MFNNIDAFQYPGSHAACPILPPNQFRHIQNGTEFNVHDSIKARSLYKQYASYNTNKYNKRKYVDGALYSSLFHECTNIMNPIPGGLIRLNVKLFGTNEISIVTITCDTIVRNKYLMALNELGDLLSHFRGNTSRKNLKDEGNMKFLGKGRLGSSKIGVYKLTNQSDLIQKSTEKVTNMAKNYYIQHGYNKEVTSINEGKRYGNMNSKNGFVSSIVQSCDLKNSAHIDVGDSNICISTWTEKELGQASGWYFLMPNTTIDGKKAIAISLRHGVTISWDGRKIMHCSALNNVGMNNHVYGTFYGTRK